MGQWGHHHYQAGEGRRLARLGRLLSLHQHAPREQVEGVRETSAEGIRALKLSLVVLAATAALQAVVVWATGSVALLGDTLHNAADALTALPLGVALAAGRRRPTRRYTYGYGRAEDLAGIAIVAVIGASAALAAYEAVRRLLDPRPVEHLVAVALAGALGFVGNEAVARYRIGVGRRIGSAALVADGLHARSDGFTSLAVVAGAAGVGIGWQAADAVAGLLITLVILGVLVGATRDISLRLMDGVSPDLVGQVEGVVATVTGVEAVSEVRVRWIGHDLRAEVRLTVDRRLTVGQAHAIAEEAHHALLHGVARLADAIVHADPSDDGSDPHATTAHHRTSAGHHHH